MFQYFPSVKKTILNGSLAERAEDFYFNGALDFPLDYTSALQASAARLHEDFQVDELDDDVINMAVDVDVDDAHEEHQSEKCRDFSMTNDIASTISSQIDGNCLTTEALTRVIEEGSSSNRQCATGNIYHDTEYRDKESVAAKGCIDNLKTQLEADFASQPQLSRASDVGAYTEILEKKSSTSENSYSQSVLVVEDTAEKESRLQEVSQILKVKHQVDEQKIRNDANTFEDRNMDICKGSEEANEHDDNNIITEAILDEKASFLVQKYLHDRRKIDQALVDLESEFSSELNRLDNETNACNLKHEIEAERIEKDRNEFRADENNNMTEQTKTLPEKLSTAVAVLELERHNTSTGMQTVEIEKDEKQNWGFFNNKLKKKSLQKEKERQEKLIEFKLREIELEKEVDDIKAQLDFVKQQAKDKENNASEWQAELDEEYRHLEDLTFATEEKLKEEVRHLNNSYAEERQRLIKEKNNLVETRKEDEMWVASEKKKLHDKFNLERGGISSAEFERNEMDNDEDGHLNKNAITLKAKRVKEEKALSLEREAFGQNKEGHDNVDLSLDSKDNPELGSDQKLRLIEQTTGEIVAHQSNEQGILEKERSKCKHILLEEDSFVNEGAVAKADYFQEDNSVKSKNVEGVFRNIILKKESEIVKKDYKGEDSSSESNTPISEDEMLDKAVTEVNYGEEDSIQSNVTGIAERRLTEARSVENDSNSTLSNTTDIKEDENSSKSGECIVPDHLAFLNQSRELEDDAPLGSLDVFDLPEVSEVSSKKLLAAVLKGKSEEDTATRPTEEDTQAMPDHVELPDRSKRSQDELSLRSPRALDLSKGNAFSSKILLATTLKKKQKEVAETLPVEAENKTMHATEKRNDRIARRPSKNLSEMRRNVEEALERAIAIRNGDLSSHHGQSISQESQMGRQVQNGASNGAPIKEICTGKSSDWESPSTSINRSATAPSPSPSRQSAHPIYAMIRESDRLSGFIRRYEKKLEQVCKSLLTLASVNGGKNEILAARQLDLPEMLDFVVKQDWYKAHSTDTKSIGVPHLIFSKVKNGNEHDSVSDKGYTITKTGKLFLHIDGPVPSDVCRFLSYLNHIEEGLTREAMLEQWKEIFLLSGDEQSQRVCDNLDKLISFCLDSNMIKK
jgi:hypothetical protein